MKKVLVLLAQGFEMIEGLAVVDICARAKIQCDTASITNEKEVKSSHGVIIKADKLLDEVINENYDALVLPGGMPGSINLRDNEKVINLVKSYNSNKKIVSAICAAPIVLNKAGILNEVDVTSHPSVKEELKNSNYIENQKVVICKNIITSRGAGTALNFGLSIIEKLGYKDEAKTIKEAIMLDFI